MSIVPRRRIRASDESTGFVHQMKVRVSLVQPVSVSFFLIKHKGIYVVFRGNVALCPRQA